MKNLFCLFKEWEKEQKLIKEDKNGLQGFWYKNKT